MRSFFHRAFCVARFFAAIVVPGAPPALADLYARTNTPLVIFDKTLPAGSFVGVRYDGGDYWVSSFRDQHIPKAAATLVKTVNFKPAITGRLNKASPVFRSVPALLVDSTGLEQPDPANPAALPAGTKIMIWRHEADDYLMTYRNEAWKSRSNPDGIVLGRLPVSVVDLDPGQTVTEVAQVLPPDPAIAAAATAAQAAATAEREQQARQAQYEAARAEREQQAQQAQYEAALHAYQATLAEPKKIGDYVCDQTGNRLGYVENVVDDRVQIRMHGVNVNGYYGIRQDYDQIVWRKGNEVGKCGS